MRPSRNNRCFVKRNAPRRSLLHGWKQIAVSSYNIRGRRRIARRLALIAGGREGRGGYAVSAAGGISQDNSTQDGDPVIFTDFLERGG